MSTDSRFRAAASSGTRLSGEILVDAHMHIDQYYNFYTPRGSFTDLLQSAQRLGIVRMYGSSLLAIRNDALRGNENALRAHREAPELFHPYIVVKPNYPEEISRIIEVAVANGIRQFKLHDDANNIPYDHRSYNTFYEYANATGAVVLFHTYGRVHVIPIMNVAKSFPSLTILLGHAGIVDEEVYQEAARKYANIHLEICNSLAWYGLIERLVQYAGADRVLFGTDMPFMSPDQQIGRVLFSRISDDEKRKILGLNALRVFGIPDLNH